MIILTLTPSTAAAALSVLGAYAIDRIRSWQEDGTTPASLSADVALIDRLAGVAHVAANGAPALLDVETADELHNVTRDVSIGLMSHERELRAACDTVSSALSATT